MVEHTSSDNRCMQEAVVQVGETVRLKSGGPAMTVQLVANDESMVYCTWFEGESLKTGAFSLKTLCRVQQSAANTDGTTCEKN